MIGVSIQQSKFKNFLRRTSVKEKNKKNNLGLFSGFFFFAVILLFINPAYAELKSLSEKAMRNETAQAGLASFSKNDTSIRMFTDIHLETWTDINSMKIGYYDNGSAGGLGWDQNWRNVKIGTSATDQMKMDGFVFKADFDDLVNTDKPNLKRLVIGTNRLIGTVQANIDSISGVVNPVILNRSTTDTAPVVYDRTKLSGQAGDETTTFTYASGSVASGETENKATNEGFFIVITPPGAGVAHPGIQIVAGYNEINIPSNPLYSQGEWWDK